jgi:hypothetical protein
MAIGTRRAVIGMLEEPRALQIDLEFPATQVSVTEDIYSYRPLLRSNPTKRTHDDPQKTVENERPHDALHPNRPLASAFSDRWGESLPVG